MASASGNTGSPQTLIQSVSRASRILIAIAGSSNGCTSRELATRLELSVSTVHNLLRTLISEGLVERGGDHRYRLGLSAIMIADGVSAMMRAPAAYRDAVDRLAERTGEAAYLSGRSGGRITLLRGVRSAHAVRVDEIPAGYSANLHARASGKVLLAFLPAAERARIVQGMSFEKLTPNTIVTAARFEEELTRVRADEIACDREEFLEGATGVSVPVWASGNVVAALSLHVPSARFQRLSGELLDALQEIARSISHSAVSYTHLTLPTKRIV